MARQDSNIFELVTVAAKAITRIGEHNRYIAEEGLVPTGTDYNFAIKALGELAKILAIEIRVAPDGGGGDV